MPHLHCIVRKGLSHKKRSLLAKALADAVHQEIGAPLEYIHVAISEVPSGQIVEAGSFQANYAS